MGGVGRWLSGGRLLELADVARCVQVTALRAQADMLGLENEKLQLAEAVEAQRERNRQLQVTNQRSDNVEGA